MESKETKHAYGLLRIVYGVVPIVAGLDKFTNLLTDWQEYLSPIVRHVVPAAAFMHVVGLIEIAAGLLVLSRRTRLGAYIVSVWLVGVAFNVLTTGHHFDVAVRDLVMAAGAFALARLAHVRDQASIQVASAAPRGAHA